MKQNKPKQKNVIKLQKYLRKNGRSKNITVNRKG